MFKCSNPDCFNYQKKVDADWNGAVNIQFKGRLRLSKEAYKILRAIL
ncbi:hypothetical protein GMMP13_1840019 [Candidatus Magnetomoraceae bacterium gMMP-13]